MGSKKISELAAAAALTGAELVPIVQGAVTVRTTATALAGVATALSLQRASNLSDLASVATARANLGLGAMALLGSTGIINVKDYGALGNGVANDTAAILAAQVAAGDRGVLFFPPGIYLIASQLVIKTSFRGAGIEETIIRASAAFVGDRMFSLNTGLDSLHVTDMTIDANDLVGVDIFKGNSDPTGTKANRLYCRDVWFYNVYKNNYCLYTDEINNVPGGLVGSLFEMCRFEGVGNNFYFGNNEDDITFLSCRFHNHKLATAGYCYYLQGVNTRFEGCYFYFNATDYIYGGERFLFFVHAYGYTFANCFFEYGHSALNAIFLGITVMTTVAFQSCHFNLSLINVVAFKAFFRGNLASTSVGYRHEVSFRDCVKYDALDYPLVHIYVDGSTSLYSVWWDIIVENCGLWNTIPRICTKSGRTEPLDIFARISGHNAGGSMSSYATEYGVQHIDDMYPGVWLHATNTAANPAIKDAFFVLVDNVLTIQRRANAHGGAFEASPVSFNILAPLDSVVLDATGLLTVSTLKTAGAGNGVWWSEGGVLDQAYFALGAGSFTLNRASSTGVYEATLFSFNIQAPANSLVLDATGTLTAITLRSAGAGNGLWLAEAGAGLDQAYWALTTGVCSLNRASSTGVYEAILVSVNIQAPANSLTIDATGKATFVSEVNPLVRLRTPTIFLQSATGIIHWDDNGGVNKGAAWAVDTAAAKVFLQRRSVSFGGNEAALFDIAIGAPANSLVIDSTGLLTALTLKTLGANNGVWWSEGGVLDQIYFNLSAGSFLVNRASSAGAYETTLVSINIQAPGNSLVIDATGTLTLVAPLLTSNGSQAAPSHSFSADPDTGLFVSTSNVLRFTTGGSERMSLSTTLLYLSAVNFQTDGDLTTGFGAWTSTGIRINVNGTAAAPSLRLNDDNTGFYIPSADQIGVTTGGVVRALVDSAGLALPTVGSGIRLAVGANGRMGEATLVAGTVTVSVASCTTSTRVLLTRKTNGGTTGRLTYTVAAGSFTITSDSGTDTSVVTYMLFEPA